MDPCCLLKHFASISYFNKSMVLEHPLGIKDSFLSSLSQSENLHHYNSIQCAKFRDTFSPSGQEMLFVYLYRRSLFIWELLPSGIWLYLSPAEIAWNLPFDTHQHSTRLQQLPYIARDAEPVLKLFLQVPFVSLIFRNPEFLNSTLRHKSSCSYILCNSIQLCSQRNPWQNSQRV